MKKFDDILICSDFDHTISSDTFKFWENDDFLSAVPQNNIDAVKYFVENGGTFAIISGRNPDEMMRVGEIMPIAPYMVISNGTALYSIRENKAIEGVTMDEGFKEVARFVYQNEAKGGQPYGTVQVRCNNTILFESTLYYANSVESADVKITFWQRFANWLCCLLE